MFSIPVYVPPVDKIINNSNRFLKKPNNTASLNRTDIFYRNKLFYYPCFYEYKSRKNQLFANKKRNVNLLVRQLSLQRRTTIPHSQLSIVP
jgi:hypothetical protein